MATTLQAAGRPAGSVGRHLRSAAYHLASFESIFLLFLYSNEIKMLLPSLPIDETLLFGALSLVVGGLVVLREGIYLRGLPIVAFGLLFVAWAAISYGWTPSRLLAERTVSYLATFNILCLVAGALIIANKRERVIRFFGLLLLLSLVLALIGLNIYFTYGNFRRWEGWDELGARRVYLGWGYTVADGMAVALALTMFSRFASLKQLFFGGLVAIYGLFLLVGGARAPLLGVFLAMLVATVVRPPRVWRGRIDVSTAQLATAFLIAAGIGVVAYLILAGQTTNTLSRFLKLLSQAENTAMASVSGPTRWLYWPAAYRFWLDAPLFGHGIASFSYLYLQGVEVAGTHPHNIILEILAELGLVGLILFGLFVWSALRNLSFARLRHDAVLVCVALFLTTGMMSSIFAKELAGGRKLFFVLGLLALRPALRTRARPAPSAEPPARRAFTLGTWRRYQPGSQPQAAHPE